MTEPKNIIKIPIKDVVGLRSNGSFLLRYKVASDDNYLQSEWSELYNLSFPLYRSGRTKTYYEIYGNTTNPTLSNSSGQDPHPSNGYNPTEVSAGVVGYSTSSISYIGPKTTLSNSVYVEDETNLYSYNWNLPEDFKLNKLFDVYISFKTEASWSDWEFYGTTSSTSITFKKPNKEMQYIQAAVFLSSNPKLTNIYGDVPAITFLSISPVFTSYYEASGTIANLTGTGPFRATLSGMADLPTEKRITGRELVGVNGTGSFGAGEVTVQSIQSATVLVISSSAALTAGTVTDIRIL